MSGVSDRIRNHLILAPQGLAEEFVPASTRPSERPSRRPASIDVFQRASGRGPDDERREQLKAQRHQALRRTYLGSGVVHPKFTAALAAFSPAARDRVAAVAPAFA